MFEQILITSQIVATSLIVGLTIALVSLYLRHARRWHVVCLGIAFCGLLIMTTEGLVNGRLDVLSWHGGFILVASALAFVGLLQVMALRIMRK